MESPETGDGASSARPEPPAREVRPKPLGRKAYGHIGHLPQSRMGAGDHKVPEGQARIACLKVRDRHDRVIVQEKLDGSNVAVARYEGEIIPLVRAGYRAASSPFSQHALFHAWVFENNERFDRLLREGERLVGEWLAQAHGTRYFLTHEPFVAFDLMTEERRTPFDEFQARVMREFITPRVLHVGAGIPFSVEAALEAVKVSGHGAIDQVEGAVWRVERRGEVDFLAKYVRPEKVDGCYLPSMTGGEAVWNWRPGQKVAHELHGGWPAQIHAPWDPDQVAALNDFQQLGHVHPFTCGNGCGVLVAHTSGWLCPCGYKQDWAWAFMADPSDPFWKNPLEALGGGRAETA
jgi:hypothetical protein